MLCFFQILCMRMGFFRVTEYSSAITVFEFLFSTKAVRNLLSYVVTVACTRHSQWIWHNVHFSQEKWLLNCSDSFILFIFNKFIVYLFFKLRVVNLHSILNQISFHIIIFFLLSVYIGIYVNYVHKIIYNI